MLVSEASRLLPGPSLIHIQCTFVQQSAIQHSDRFVSVFCAGHLHKAEPAWLPVSLSLMILTWVTEPNAAKIWRSAPSEVLKLRFPTKMFFIELPLKLSDLSVG